MKIHKVLFLALCLSALLAVSVEAGDRHRNNGKSQAAPGKARSSSHSFSSGSGFRGSSRTIGSSHHFSSTRMHSTPTPRLRVQRSTFDSSRNVASFNQHRFGSGALNRSNGVGRLQNNKNFGTTQDNRVNRFSSLGNSNRNFNRTSTANRTAQFGTGGRNRRVGNISPGHNHVFAHRSGEWNRTWDRHRDHWWNGHRCRWVNNTWIIFDIGFIPWFGWPYYDYYAYDYYPPAYPYAYGYDPYGYNSGVYEQSVYYDQGGYDPSYSEQGGYNYNDRSNYDDQGRNGSAPYDQSTAVTVADVQDQLTSAGFYHGKIDGVLGPETRHALLRYQSAKGLRMTGSLTAETQQSLGLAQGAGELITDQ